MADLLTAFACAKGIQALQTIDLVAQDEELLKTIMEANGVTYVDTLYVHELANFAHARSGKRKLFGCMVKNKDNDLIVILRCTETKLEIVHDAMFLPSFNYMKGAEFTLVASGFLRVYQSLHQGKEGLYAAASIANMHDINDIIICGHSLGGAVATLLGFELAQVYKLKPKVYTFGSPRVGDFQFAKKFNELIPDSMRVIMAYDPITTVPIFPGYWHVQTAYVLHPQQKLTKLDPLAHHHISTYIWALSLVTPGVDIVPIDPQLVPKPSLWDKLKEKVTTWWKGEK